MDTVLDSLARRLDFLCLGLAVGGGLLLLALIGLTVFSIMGRYFFLTPLAGDFELVQAGTAVAVFSFLPLAQIRRKNLIVDAFSQRAPPLLRGLLDVVGALLYAGLAGLLAWRMGVGGIYLRQDGEVSMILGLPIWWAFPPIVFSLALLLAAALVTVAQSFREARR